MESNPKVNSGKGTGAKPKAAEKKQRSSSSRVRSSRKEKSTFEQIVNSSVGRTVVREVTRGLLGVLGLGGRSKKRKGSWF